MGYICLLSWRFPFLSHEDFKNPARSVSWSVRCCIPCPSRFSSSYCVENGKRCVVVIDFELFLRPGDLDRCCMRRAGVKCCSRRKEHPRWSPSGWLICENVRSYPFLNLTPYSLITSPLLNLLRLPYITAMSLWLFVKTKNNNFVVVYTRKEGDAQQTNLWWTFLPSGLLQLVGLSAWRVSFEQTVLLRGGCSK